MKHVIYILICCLVSSFAPAESAGQALMLGLDVQGRSVQDRALSSQALGLKLVASHRREWIKAVESSLRLRADIETGSGYSAFTDPYGARQRFLLEEAALTFIPTAEVQIKGGALSHGALNNPLLIDRKAFLGVSERVQIPIGDLLFEVSAEQTLVPGQSTAILPENRGVLPSFFHERVRVAYQPKIGFQAAAHLGHFKFSAPGNDLAAEARMLGNSVTGLGKTGTRFVYGFEGAEAAIAFGYRDEHKLAVSLNLVGIVNYRTIQSNGRGLAAVLTADIPVGDRYSLRPEISYFRAESDVSPANFARQDWGHTNRHGFSIAAGGTLIRDNIHLILRYTAATAIRPTSFQSDFHFIGAELGVEYGLL